LIEKGAVEVEIRAPMKHVEDKVDRGLFGLGLVKKFTSMLASRTEEPREEEKTSKDDTYITIDAPVVLPYSKPSARMGVGDLFGEMTCMSKYPRSATVVAAEDCTVLEMLSNVLYIMQRTPSFRQILEKNYRERAINNHLRSVGILAAVRKDEAQFERLVDYL